MRVRGKLVFGVVVVVLCALLLPSLAAAHNPGVVLRGFGTPTIDGLLGPGEWTGAATRDLEVARPGGAAAPATVFVMNDRSNLYLGLRIMHGALGADEALYFAFDNDHDGLTETGDDLFRVTGTSEGYRYPEQGRTLTLRAPPEGVVGRAYVSATQEGLEAFGLPADAREIWAHFEFTSRPQKVCKTKKVKGKRRRVCAKTLVAEVEAQVG